MNNLLDQFSMLHEYWEFSNKTEKILNDFYQEKLEELFLPIDIKSIARHLGFDICNSKLSNEFYGYLYKETIFLSRNLTYKEQQWVVAQGIAMHHLGIRGSINNPFFIKNNIDTVYVDVIKKRLFRIHCKYRAL